MYSSEAHLDFLVLVYSIPGRTHTRTREHARALVLLHTCLPRYIDTLTPDNVHTNQLLDPYMIAC